MRRFSGFFRLPFGPWALQLQVAVQWIRLVAVAAVALVFLGSACGSRSMPAAEGGATADQTTDDASTACTSTIEAILAIAYAPCPSTFSTDPQQLCGSFPPIFGLNEQDFGGLRALWWDWGTHGIACFYDASGARVGVVQYDDVPTYCNQRSFSIQAGQIAELQVTTPGFVIPCSVADAGN